MPVEGATQGSGEGTGGKTGGLGGIDPLSLLLGGAGTGIAAFGAFAGNKALSNAYTAALKLQEKTTRQSQELAWGMYKQGRSDLAPYRAMGLNALPELEKLVYGGKGKTDFNAFGMQPGGAPDFKPSFLDQGYFGLDPDVSDRAGLPKTGDFDTGIVQPGIVNRTGSSKTRASKNVEDTIPIFWGSLRTPGLTPTADSGGLAGAVVAGKITMDEAWQAASEVWERWKQSLKDSGVDDEVYQRSVASQKGLEDFDAFLRGRGWKGPSGSNKTVGGGTGGTTA